LPCDKERTGTDPGKEGGRGEIIGRREELEKNSTDLMIESHENRRSSLMPKESRGGES
jgi:hypothetical protein